MHLFRRLWFTIAFILTAAGASAATPIWTNLEHGLGADFTELNSVAFGNGVFVAIKSPLTGGTLHYATSTDGTAWTARTIATTISSSGSAQRVRFLNGRFLIMPIGISGSAGVALSLSSTDGITWTSATVGSTTTSPDEIDFGNGRVLAVGSNGYFIGSTDFSSWSNQSTSLQGAFAIQDVAFGNGRWFVTTNGGGEVATSTDGITFTKVEGLSAPGGFRVEYGNNTWFFYSQANNAVSTDGVNFTTVTRTANVTPGGTGNIRFINGRFLAYGPSTFQSSTDGQTWTNFGAFPSLGSGFIFSAIYDYAYGNGKYVAVGSRNFPPTSALIQVASEPTPTDPGSEPVAGTFSVAFQVGVTLIPGSSTASTSSLMGYALHNGGVLVGAPHAGSSTAALVQHKNGSLSTLLASTAGMPGGGNIRSFEVVGDGSAAHVIPRSTTVNFASNTALLKVANGAITTEIESSHALIDRGTFFTSEFRQPSAAGGAVAFIGRRGNDDAYIFKRQGGTTTVVAESGVTTQPNGTGAGKFHRFSKVLLGADGRITFEAYNEGSFFNDPTLRRGIYVEQNGAIAVVADNTTTLPGTATKFNFTSGGDALYSVSPDGSKIIFSGGNFDYSSETSERHGVYLYANGAITTIADTSMSVGGGRFTFISHGAITDDGTAIFYGSAGNSTDLYRARNGTIELFVHGGVPGNTRSPGGLWIHDGQVFFYAYTSSLQIALFRKPVDGTGEPEVAINLYEHPDFVAIDARSVENMQFAGDQVLLEVGAVFNGIQRSALVYGPASAVTGESASGGGTPESQSVTAGGSATLETSATGTVQWQRNGAAIAGGTSGSLSLTNIQPADTGIYAAAVTNGGTTTLQPAILGITTASKLVGTGMEFADITHPNGNVFDQILLQSAAASFTADASLGQITRLSYVDMNNDIVQVEFSGAGTVSIVLEGASGGALAGNYNQPGVDYMKGHAGIVITGADETTHFSVFTVGRGTAVNQSLFRDEVDYDGVADISFIAIQSPTGKFGGLRTANVSFWNTQGFTGVYAPGVQFNGPVYVHDIDARDTATPVLMIGSATGNTWITGGNLEQTNDRAVQVSGLTQLHFKDGVTSHYVAAAPLPAEYFTAQANQARLEQDGVDVTATTVVNP